MLIGAHMSIAGGVDKSVARGLAVGCRTMQIFTKNASQWTAPPLDPAVIRSFHRELSASGIAPVVSHDSYLINLASPDPALRNRSIAAFTDEMERAGRLGLLGVVMHPGAHVGAGEARGLDRVARALLRILKLTRTDDTLILLENTAGQGTTLGRSFEQLAGILGKAGGHPRLAVCLDTCHLHAAGYDLTTDSAYRETMAAFDRIIGLDRLRCLHMNDSVKPLGSRLDRHADIGKGTLGERPFRRIMRDKRLERIPKILETPKSDDSGDDDRRNLAVLKRLAR